MKLYYTYVILTNQISAFRVDNGSYSTAGKNIPRLPTWNSTRFRSSRSNGEKATVAGGWGSLGRSYGGYFTHKSLESDMEKYGKLLFSSFAEILCFCACGNAASLPFCVKWH